MYLYKFDTVIITAADLERHHSRKSPLHLLLSNLVAGMRSQPRVVHTLNLAINTDLVIMQMLHNSIIYMYSYYYSGSIDKIK